MKMKGAYSTYRYWHRLAIDMALHNHPHYTLRQIILSVKLLESTYFFEEVTR